jgi:hypothetical protein
LHAKQQHPAAAALGLDALWPLETQPRRATSHPPTPLCLPCCRPSTFPQILLFNLPVNFAQGTSIFWAYVVGFKEAPLTAIQV